MEPLISVIVPVYNVEPYLRKCVDSILNQTYRNLEIILVDDGSPDGCGAICDEYAARDSRVKVIHKENGGLSDARNVGMEKSTGVYLSFVDSDDMLPANAMKVLLDTAISEHADLVIGGHVRFTDEPSTEEQAEHTVKRWTKVEAMEDMLKNGCASWARLYKREIHLPVLFPVGEINEDEAIVLRLLERCDCVAVTDSIVYYYRCRPESITTVTFSVKKMAWFRHCKNNLEYVRARHPELEACATSRYRSSVTWSLHEISKMNSGMNQEWKLLRRQLRESFLPFWKLATQNEKGWMLLTGFVPRAILRWLFRDR